VLSDLKHSPGTSTNEVRSDSLPRSVYRSCCVRHKLRKKRTYLAYERHIVDREAARELQLNRRGLSQHFLHRPPTDACTKQHRRSVRDRWTRFGPICHSEWCRTKAAYCQAAMFIPTTPQSCSHLGIEVGGIGSVGVGKRRIEENDGVARDYLQGGGAGLPLRITRSPGNRVQRWTRQILSAFSLKRNQFRADSRVLPRTTLLRY
jgi:hypothetical protein